MNIDSLKPVTIRRINVQPLHGPAAIALAWDMGEAFVKQLPHVIGWAKVGSATYLDPANDVDFMLLIDGKGMDGAIGVPVMDYCSRILTAIGFSWCDDYDRKEGEWQAMKMNHLNLIVTDSKERFDKQVVATEVCKYLHLTKKHDRIAICRMVRDGLTSEQAINVQNRELAAEEHDAKVSRLGEHNGGDYDTRKSQLGPVGHPGADHDFD